MNNTQLKKFISAILSENIEVDEEDQFADLENKNLKKALLESDVLLPMGGKTVEIFLTNDLSVICPKTDFSKNFWSDPVSFGCGLKSCGNSMNSQNLGNREDQFLFFIIDRALEVDDSGFKHMIEYDVSGAMVETCFVNSHQESSWERQEFVDNLGAEKALKVLNKIQSFLIKKGKLPRESAFSKDSLDPSAVIDDDVAKAVADEEEKKVSQDTFDDSMYTKDQKYLEKMSRNHNLGVRMMVASNKNTPISSLVRLALEDGDDQSIVQALVNNPSLPKKIFYDFSKTKDERIVAAVARGVFTPKELLSTLIDHNSSMVRSAAAGNKKTPSVDLANFVRKTVLGEISEDRDTEENSNFMKNVLGDRYDSYNNMKSGLWDALKNPNTPVAVLKTMVGFKGGVFDSSIAENENVSSEILLELLKTKNKDVLMKISSNKNCPENILIDVYKNTSGDERLNIVYRIASNENKNKDKILSFIIRNGTADERKSIAMHSTNVSENILKLLTIDNDINIISAVLSNKYANKNNFDFDIDFKTLLKISQDKNPYVRLGAALYNKTPEEILEKLVDDFGEISTSLGQGGRTTISSVVAANKNISMKSLLKFSNSKRKQERSSAALNPNLPMDILNKLISDKDSHVRSVAKYALQSRNDRKS